MEDAASSKASRCLEMPVSPRSGQWEKGVLWEHSRPGGGRAHKEEAWWRLSFPFEKQCIPIVTKSLIDFSELCAGKSRLLAQNACTKLCSPTLCVFPGTRPTLIL
jgi:hypothetical protein